MFWLVNKNKKNEDGHKCPSPPQDSPPSHLVKTKPFHFILRPPSSHPFFYLPLLPRRKLQSQDIAWVVYGLLVEPKLIKWLQPMSLTIRFDVIVCIIPTTTQWAQDLKVMGVRRSYDVMHMIGKSYENPV